MQQSWVQVQEPERMNLLGLLLQGYLERQLREPSLQRKAARLRGDFGVRVGEMGVTLSFGPQNLTIRRGMEGRTRARMTAPMEELVPLVASNTGTVGTYLAAVVAVLEGRISIGGNPFALLGLLPLMLSRKPRKALPAAVEGAR